MYRGELDPTKKIDNNNITTPSNCALINPR